LAVLEDIKILQNIAPTDISKDGLLTLYIRKAVTLITTYLNISTVAITTTDPITGIVTTILPIDVSTTYPDAVIEYVIICMNKRGNEGIKQGSQGSRSQSYGNDLPDSVIALLPVPYATLIRTTPIPTGVILP
jgi:hypothetical protein